MSTTIAKPRTLQVASARDLGPMFVNNRHRMIGQDGAFSIPIEPGKTLWFFGDTLIGKRIPGQSLWYRDGQPVGHSDMSGKGPIERMINNTGALLNVERWALNVQRSTSNVQRPAFNEKGPHPALSRSTGREEEVALDDFEYICNEHGQLRPLIPLEGDEHPDWDRIWCQHGICIDDRVVLSFIKVKMLDAPGPFPVNFEIVGSGLAAGSTRDWQFHRILSDGDSILWRANAPHFATAFLPDADFVYLFGTVKQGNTHNCYLARTRRDQIERFAQTEYCASSRPSWSRDLADAIPLFGGMPSEMSVSWNEHLQSYLAVHSLDLTGKIVARTAPKPWGPWSEPIVLWTVNAKRDKPLPYPTLIYAGKEHPELAADGGRRIYLTCIEFEEYFPHLVEVSLK